MSVDQALSNVTAAEATFNADALTVSNLQTAVATATAPLAAAQAAVVADASAYNDAVDVAVAALTASKK